MATVHQTLISIRQYCYRRLNLTEKHFVDKSIWGLDGLGDLNDHEVSDYLTDKQVSWIRRI